MRAKDRRDRDAAEDQRPRAAAFGRTTLAVVFGRRPIQGNLVFVAVLARPRELPMSPVKMFVTAFVFRSPR